MNGVFQQLSENDLETIAVEISHFALLLGCFIASSAEDLVKNDSAAIWLQNCRCRRTLVRLMKARKLLNACCRRY